MADNTLTSGQGRQWPLALVRIAIGWHFLYEGFSKLLYPGWTSAGYLQSSTGPLAGFFQWLGSSAGLVKVVDQLNIWGLILIGLALMLGLLVRYAAWFGIALLALYYLAYPPLFAPIASGVSEGNYLIVNKNLVELLALVVVLLMPATRLGLDALLARRRQVGGTEQPEMETGKVVERAAPAYLGPIPRRQLLASLAGVPFLGAFVLAVLKRHGWHSFEAAQLKNLAGQNNVFVASATLKSFQFSGLKDLKGRLPQAKIGNVSLSRMILGGNLIGGWAHARDLLYVDKLVKAYHNRDRVFQTFALAEACGINAVLTNPALCTTINNYWRAGGKIQFISDCGGKDLIQMIQKSIDHGACACYIQGGVADRLVQEGKFDLMAQGLELIRKNRLPAGIGAHKLSTVQASIEKGLRPDFWMKTLHRVDYWSAQHTPEHDNNWCEDPAAVVAFMKGLKEPWIAFKILGAGAILPKVGFKYAFENGADFICVGMYDFQIVDDVNLALEVLNGGLIREREWRA